MNLDACFVIVQLSATLVPFLFSLKNIDISDEMDFGIRLLVDGSVCYRLNDSKSTKLKLQNDTDRQGKLDRRFQPIKCSMLRLTRKRINKASATYSSKGTENVHIVE